MILLNGEKRGEFDILNEISDHVALVQLVGTASNANHDLSINVRWICDPKYKRALTLIKESLNIICYSSKYEKEMYAKLSYAYLDIRYVNTKLRLLG